MKRKQLALLSIPVSLVIGLWMAAPWWWPYVQSLGVPLDQNAARIQTIASVLSVLPFVLGLLFSYLKSLGFFPSTPTHDLFSETAVLEAITPEAIRATMEKGGQINWIDRVATEPRDLQRYGRLAIVGRSRQGKTREAAELIRRAVALDLVRTACIYQPGQALRFVAESSLRAAILARVDRPQAVLLFIDDLPYHYPSAPDLARLHTALTALTECKTAYVIITARDDQLTVDHVAWLAAQQFHQVAVPDLSAEQTGRLVDNAAGLWQLQVNAEARQALIDGNNGTPELPLISLKFLDSEGIKQVNGPAVTQVLRENVAAAWEQMRRETIEKRQPAAAYLLDALADFHVAGVRKAAPLVLAYAMHLWQHSQKQAGGWFRLHREHTLRQALIYLRHFDITINDGQLRHPDQVVENGRDSSIAAQSVGEFLLRYRQWLRHPWLRRFQRDQEAQRWALFDLGLTAQNQQAQAAASRYYSAALAIEPHFWFYNNRGNARDAQGDLPGAITDYDTAIRLNPAYATAYNNRGNARKAQGDLPGAITDYEQALALTQNPEHRGIMARNAARTYQTLERWSEARDAYQQVVTSQPDNLLDWISLGTAARHCADEATRQAAIQQARHLVPAEDLYNRACLESVAGNAEQALDLLAQAVAAKPEAKVQARQDPNLYWVRAAPHFTEIIGPEEILQDKE